MVKVKNKRNVIKSSKNAFQPKENPFEMHINKQKFNVLGQKMKNDKGLPGISRMKAIKKRNNTLLPEFALRNKSNKLLDRRIGERNVHMTAEDRITARFTAERLKSHTKKSIFNLDDDEVLTHKGQTLNEIEKFDDPRSDDEFSDDGKPNSGRLDDEFVENLHFGGGLLTNTKREGAKSHKDIIEQLIAESKKRKAEKQKTKEQTVELTNKLDSEWKDLLPLVNTSKKPDPEMVKVKNDDYDKVMQELRFEARGQPTDRLKTEDEIAKEEKERLEVLEKNRLARMKGFVEDEKPKHRSADDLDDGFLFEDINTVTLSYDQEGNPNYDFEKEVDDKNKNVEENSENDEDGSENEDESGSEDEEEEEDNLSDLKNDSSESDEEINENLIIDEKSPIAEKSKSAKEKLQNVTKDSLSIKKSEIKETESEKKSDSKKEKIQSKAKESNEIDKTKREEKSGDKKEQNNAIESLNSNVINTEEKSIKEKPQNAVKDNLSEVKKNQPEEQNIDENIPDKIKKDILHRKEIMEKARKELPFTFAIPETYEDLFNLLNTYDAYNQNVIIERMIKCNHISLGSENREKLNNLFTYLLQYLNDIFNEKDVTRSFLIFDHIVPHIYDLLQMNTELAHNCIIEVIKEKHSDYQKDPKKYPGLDTLIFFKLVSILFPTSDFRHQVVTPALIFMNQILTRCKVKSRVDIASGLFLVSLVLEYTSLSQRFLPSVIIFLHGLLCMSIQKFTVCTVKALPPFYSSGPYSSLLELKNPVKEITDDLILKAEDLISTSIDDDFKIRVLYNDLKLCTEFYTQLNKLASSCEIFRPILNVIDLIDAELYPKNVQKVIEEVKTLIADGIANKKLEYIVIAKKRPKALRLYEPSIEKVYEFKKYKSTSREKGERDKLLHKYKREKKGALREIRRDTAFLSKLKIRNQVQSDVERKRKVKEIFSGASEQQGELNSLKRKKK